MARKTYPQGLRTRAMKLVAEARRKDPQLSLNAAVNRIGAQLDVNPSTLRRWCEKSATDVREVGDPKKLDEQEFTAARKLLESRGASSALWQAEDQIKFARRRSITWGLTSWVIWGAVWGASVPIWIWLVWSWVFSPFDDDGPTADSVTSVEADVPFWQGWLALIVFIGVVGLTLSAMLSISSWVATRVALLPVPFESAYAQLDFVRHTIRSQDVDRWTNIAEPFLGFWHRWRLKLSKSRLKPLGAAERVLLSSARGRRYRTAGARDAERRDRARAAATLSWIELRLTREGESFKAEAITWIAAIQQMTIMRDWSMRPLPGDDLLAKRKPVTRILGRFLVAALSLALAAIPVVALIAPHLVPRWR